MQPGRRPGCQYARHGLNAVQAKVRLLQRRVCHEYVTSMSEETAHSETAGSEQDERYHRLMELYPDLVCIQVAGNIASINTAGALLLGVQDPDGLIGKPLADFF